MPIHSERPVPSSESHAYIDKGLALTFLLAASFAIRVLFFNGPFGSDDIVYLARSIDVANGVWSSANYNGALRYGFNMPEGLLLRVFGINEFTANLWPLFCSLAEILVVYLFASKLWCRRSALFAGLVMASFPIQIALATRIHADSVVCFFITLVFFLFYLGEKSNSRSAYLICGFSMGLVFWTKELAIITILPFFLYPLLFRRINGNWIYVVIGGAALLLLHFALMQWIAGDPLHVFKVVTGQVNRNFVESGQGDDSAWYYFKYLFVDIRHTWIAPFFVFPFIFLAIRGSQGSSTNCCGDLYILFWLASLLFFLSFTPVSFHPLRLAMKQSNYLSIFLAPIAMISGRQIANLPKWASLSVISVVVVGGVGLGALQQANYRVFTSNSKAAVLFSEAHPDEWILGTENNARIANEYSYLIGNDNLSKLFYTFDDKFAQGDPNSMISQQSDDGYLIVDQQTMDWVNPMAKLNYPLACWQEVDRLTPTGLGAGNYLVDWLIAMAHYLPVPLAQRLTPPLQALSQPKPAIVYRVNKHKLLCGEQAETTP
jgi:hypothetical protein